MKLKDTSSTNPKNVPDTFNKINTQPTAIAQEPPPIPEYTQVEIINCVENATKIVHDYTPNVPQSQVARKTGITLRNQPFVLEAIEYAQAHPDTVPHTLSIFD